MCVRACVCACVFVCTHARPSPAQPLDHPLAATPHPPPHCLPPSPPQDARKEMAAGTWLCPHCYEEEHPEEGWMCNSSICMTRRGFKVGGGGLVVFVRVLMCVGGRLRGLISQVRSAGTHAYAFDPGAQPS